jgi:hypothetical protein
MRVVMLCVAFMMLPTARLEAAPVPVEKNVVYGMYSANTARRNIATD